MSPGETTPVSRELEGVGIVASSYEPLEPKFNQFRAPVSGRDYEFSPYLKVLKQHQDHFTVFSGVSHPEVDGGHPADNCFLTAAPHPGSGGFRNTISLDQYMAERIGHLTRFPSMTLGVNVQQGQRMAMSKEWDWRQLRLHPPPERCAAWT